MTFYAVETLRFPKHPVVKTFERLGYPYKPGQWELFGVRMGAGVTISNKFDDYLGVFRMDAAGWLHVHTFPATTDPGKYYADNPLNPSGCALMLPGHYPGAYVLGKHKGRPAIVQQGEGRVKYWRRDGDEVHGPYSDPIGLNIHDQKTDRTTIGRSSAGCQVFKYKGDLAFVRNLLKGRNAIDYTLLTEEEIRNTIEVSNE